MAAIFEAMDRYHPKVPLVSATDRRRPSAAGLGIGSALMRHALARCDRDGAAARFISDTGSKSSEPSRPDHRRS
jgi:GNAT superfamily N-acetyltransferase